jgi:hypothetical protein
VLERREFKVLFVFIERSDSRDSDLIDIDRVYKNAKGQVEIEHIRFTWDW